MKIKCFLFGHKISPFTDSGYAICERCNMHSFYDNPNCNTEATWPYFDSDAVLLRPYFYLRYKAASFVAWRNSRNRDVICEHCAGMSKQKDWDGITCPLCQQDNLPF